MNNTKWLTMISVILACLLIGIFIFKKDITHPNRSEKSVPVASNLQNGMSFNPGKQTISIQDIKRIMVQNDDGNTFIKQAKQEDISIEAIVATDNSANGSKYKVSQVGPELRIEVKNDKSTPLNLTITIPEDLKEIDSKSTFGNIRGALKETNFIRFVTGFGNLVTEFEKVNQHGKYTFVTDVGQILTIVPDGTKLNYVNQSYTGDTFLSDIKVNKSAVTFITTVRSAGWIPPLFYSKSSFEEMLRPEQPVAVTNQQLEEDLEETIRLMKELHPYVKQNPLYYEPIFERARKKAQVVKTREGLYFIIKEIMVSAKDGHTSTYFIEDTVLLPEMKWTKENEWIVMEDMKPFQKGDLILALGEKEVKTIIEEIRTKIPADNEWGIKSAFNRYLKNATNLRELGLVSDSEEVKVVFERDGKEQTVLIPTVSQSEISPITYNFENHVKNPYSWSIDPSNKYGTFTLDECNPSEIYTRMLKEFFAEMKKKNISNLVIDIRKNGGGNAAVAYEFLSYLNIDSINNGFNQQKNHKVSNELLFNGNVYVLTSYYTFSAGTDIAKIFQGNGIGKLVGEPPGNNASYGGNIHMFTLKNSGIGVVIPSTKNPAPVPADKQNLPLTMDYPIDVTRDAILNDQDLWLEKVKKLTSH